MTILSRLEEAEVGKGLGDYGLTPSIPAVESSGGVPHVKGRPMLFSGVMVNALLSGRKTQTRRVMKPQPYEIDGRWHVDARKDESCLLDDFVTGRIGCPPYCLGDRLWVKETWRPTASLQPWDLDVTYRADGAVRTIKDGEFGDRDWTMPKAAATGNVSPLFMPRWASRLTLEITDLRCERLNDCSRGDAAAEGLIRLPASGRYVVERGDQYFGSASFDPRVAYSWLWDSINGPGSWAANPWVWVVTFKVLKVNDALSAPPLGTQGESPKSPPQPLHQGAKSYE